MAEYTCFFRWMAVAFYLFMQPVYQTSDFVVPHVFEKPGWLEFSQSKVQCCVAAVTFV
jgi:hypothetical protein